MLVLGIIIFVAIVAIGYFISTQRSLVSLDEMCKNALSQIEVQLNSRFDEAINQQSDLLSQMMGKLNVVFEQYPDLKASDLYIEAQQGQKQYEENVRISRMVYNDTATKMNRMVRQWPSSIVASTLNFTVKEYLKIDDEQKKSYPNLDEAFKK